MSRGRGAAAEVGCEERGARGGLKPKLGATSRPAPGHAQSPRAQPRGGGGGAEEVEGAAQQKQGAGGERLTSPRLDQERATNFLGSVVGVCGAAFGINVMIIIFNIQLKLQV